MECSSVQTTSVLLRHGSESSEAPILKQTFGTTRSEGFAATSRDHFAKMLHFVISIAGRRRGLVRLMLAEFLAPLALI